MLIVLQLTSAMVRYGCGGEVGERVWFVESAHEGALE